MGKRCEVQCELNSMYKGLEECLGKENIVSRVQETQQEGWGQKTWFQLVAHQLIHSWNVESGVGAEETMSTENSSVERIVATYTGGKGIVTRGIALNPQDKDSLTHLTLPGPCWIWLFPSSSFFLPSSLTLLSHLLCPCSMTGILANIAVVTGRV